MMGNVFAAAFRSLQVDFSKKPFSSSWVFAQVDDGKGIKGWRTQSVTEALKPVNVKMISERVERFVFVLTSFSTFLKFQLRFVDVRPRFTNIMSQPIAASPDDDIIRRFFPSLLGLLLLQVRHNKTNKITFSGKNVQVP